MPQNMGLTDRILRVIIAIAIVFLYFLGYLSGWLLIVLGIVAGIFLVTSVIGFCPLYVLLRISTKKK